ncbi:MAG: hypothetical protein OXC37_04170, partial [Bdellovibrionaceae bacterium]|nr:hypothetical protein [Pseudobdellovibrionaceae bacterium]
MRFATKRPLDASWSNPNSLLAFYLKRFLSRNLNIYKLGSKISNMPLATKRLAVALCSNPN